MPTCQKCKASVDADDEFCPECGARIRTQFTGTAPAREAVAVQPKKHRFLKAVIIIIVIIFLLRACASFSSFSSPSLVYLPTQEVSAPGEGERLISIETPPPRVNPIPEPEPLRQNPEAAGCSSGGEQLAVDFKSGGTTTVKIYSGIVLVSVAGTGQSSGIAYNDAFYVFTSYSDGSPIAPEIQDPFLLYIDNQPAFKVAAAPGYNPEHSYAFTFDAGSIPRAISFRVGDGYTADNSGAFAIRVC